MRRHRTGKRLHIGIHRDEVGFIHPIEDDSIERVAAGTADARDFDRNEFLFAFR